MASSSIPYYLIATRTNGRWEPQWGCYDRSECVQEVKDSYQRQFSDDDLLWAKKDIKILRCADDSQQTCNKAVSDLNSESVNKTANK